MHHSNIGEIRTTYRNVTSNAMEQPASYVTLPTKSGIYTDINILKL